MIEKNLNLDAEDPTATPEYQAAMSGNQAAAAVAEPPEQPKPVPAKDAARQAVARSSSRSRAVTPAMEDNFKEIKKMVEQSLEKIRTVLPQRVSPERFIRVALGTIARSEKLMQCSPQSIAVAMLTAAELGLDAGGMGGQSYLVPYYDSKSGQMQCQLIPGYRGLVDLARRSGRVLSVSAYLVHERDTFEPTLGTSPGIKHIPAPLNEDAGPVVAAYAVAEIVGGAPQFTIMRTEEMDRIRARSKAADSGPWVTDTHEMYRKTVTRRLCKSLPSSPELDEAMELDAKAEGGI